MRACRACGAPHQGDTFVAREMMHGTRDEFAYFECAACASLQIAGIPADLGRYYPSGYYSYAARPPGRLQRFFKRQRAAWVRGARWNLLGRLLARRYGVPELFEWTRRAGVAPDDAVLDVGSGAGGLLLEMSAVGFRDLTGIDPFLQRDFAYPGVRILKRPVEEVEGTYDFVMLHHSLEHMPDPAAALRHVHRLLRPGRLALVRVPVAGTYGWRAYGPHWAQLDPPRHLLVPSERGMRILAEAAGLEVVEVAYDAYEFLFWASEMYRDDIPLTDPATRFTPAQLADFRARARALNAARDGDQAAFYLRRPQAPRDETPVPSPTRFVGEGGEPRRAG